MQLTLSNAFIMVGPQKPDPQRDASEKEKDRATTPPATTPTEQQALAMNRSLLATMAQPNIATFPVGSLGLLPTAGMPPFHLGNGRFNAGLSNPLYVAGNQILGQFPGIAASSLLSSGIQALQGYQHSQATLGGMGLQQRGRPNQKEMQDALETLAAANTSIASKQKKAKPDSGQRKLPVLVFMDCDEESLSEYQCLLRKQIELFEATVNDVQWNAQGRNKAIVLGQVGIRCRWCSRLPTWSRSRGAVYYSATLDGLYQAAQNMAKNHLCKHCRLIPGDVRNNLIGLRDCKRRAAGGKKYWAEGAKVLGIYQTEQGLRFLKSSTASSHQNRK